MSPASPEIDYECQIKITGLSEFIQNPQQLSHAHHDGWDFDVSITNSPNGPLPCYLRIQVTAPPPWSAVARASERRIWVTIFLDHLDDTPFQRRQDLLSEFNAQWKSGTGRVRFACMVPWPRLWDQNEQNRADDGFRLRLDVNSGPAPSQHVYDGVLLRSAGRFISGDLPDTQFVFLRPFRNNKIKTPPPLYAHSALLAERSDYFRNLLENHGSSSTPITFCADEGISDEYDPDIDSDAEDCEDGQVVPSTNNRINGGMKVIIVRDAAYTTWKAMLFYLHTTRVRFAHLTSRGVPRDARAPEHIGKGWPPSPSPKSMYRLARMIGLHDLAEKARISIHDRLSKHNIIHELFSPFTARYPDMREMELAYLFQRWTILKDSKSLKEKLQQVKDGRLPHAAEIAKAIRDHEPQD